MVNVINQTIDRNKETIQPEAGIRQTQWYLYHTTISYTRSFKYPSTYEGGIGHV